MSRIKQQAAVLHDKLQLAMPIIIESLVSAASEKHTRAKWLSWVCMLQSDTALCCSSSSIFSARLLTSDLLCAGKSKKKTK